MRRVARVVAFCQQYELEDVAAEATGADRVEVGALAPLERSRRAYRLARFGTGSVRLARALAPAAPALRIERDYDLFFPVFNNVHELYALAAVDGWRKRCRRAACFVAEAWAHELPRYLVELLAPFDHVFLGVRHPVDDIARISGRPCTYLPLAADVLRFAPAGAERAIDVCNIGRRSPATHGALLALARERGLFYYYDTVSASGAGGKQRTFTVDDPAEHRALLAALLRRSRYYIANRGRVNEPEFTRGRDEVSGRFYEGAAAGTVMLGEPPRTEEFSRQFDWPDAVIPLPFDSPDVGRVLAALDADPERLARIRRDNVANAALRHDWGRRLRTVYETLGLPPTPGMLEREARLDALAARARAAGAGDGRGR
jgi:hypothetical protein